jgi:hypothetical protein
MRGLPTYDDLELRPRLTFSFGFADLGAGRYLEAWIPANLIFDQFPLNLDLRVVGTAIPHTPIPPWAPITGSSPFPHDSRHSRLLEVRATDTLNALTATVTLPISGTRVNIEAWKLTGSSVDLRAQIANLKAWLATNESSRGPLLAWVAVRGVLSLRAADWLGGPRAGDISSEAREHGTLSGSLLPHQSGERGGSIYTQFVFQQAPEPSKIKNSFTAIPFC